jgi:hypothetical protein
MSDIAEPPETEGTTVVPAGANWSAPEAFTLAISLADAVHQTDVDHRASLVRALVCTARLIEEWRGEHREEIDANLGSYAPGLAKGVAKGDEILAVVKCIFHKRKQDHSLYANALRQALNADKQHADDLAVYFTLEAPTKRAKQWSKDHRRPPKPTTRLEVAIPGVLKLPENVTIPPDGLLVLLIEKNGKSMLGIPQPRGRKQTTV